MSRFIRQSGNASASHAKPSAFLPPLDRSEISVLVNGTLTPVQIWQWGDAHVKPEVSLRAELDSESVEAESLFIEEDGTPPGHASIKGWPPDKDDRRAIAVALATDSTLRRRPA